MTSENADLSKRYENMFGQFPPVFGYPDDELFEALSKSLETKTPLRGYDDIINDELGIVDYDLKKAKKIKL